VIPFFAFDPAIRKIIYTTNAIESLNRVIRKSIKTRGSFPTDDAATKLIYRKLAPKAVLRGLFGFGY
jgi:putative transposase